MLTTHQVFANASGGADALLPLAHTCFNQIEVPEYSSYAVLRERIFFSLDHLDDAGFGMA